MGSALSSLRPVYIRQHRNERPKISRPISMVKPFDETTAAVIQPPCPAQKHLACCASLSQPLSCLRATVPVPVQSQTREQNSPFCSSVPRFRFPRLSEYTADGRHYSRWPAPDSGNHKIFRKFEIYTNGTKIQSLQSLKQLLPRSTYRTANERTIVRVKATLDLGGSGLCFPSSDSTKNNRQALLLCFNGALQPVQSCARLSQRMVSPFSSRLERISNCWDTQTWRIP